MRPARIRSSRFVLCLSGLVFCVLAMCCAKAADDAGRYIGYGPGGKHCEDIGPAIKAGHEPLFQAWLSGFITSENYRLAGNKDLLGDQDLPKAWRWMREFCNAHRSAALADVAALLVVNKLDVIIESRTKAIVRPAGLPRPTH